MKRMKTFGLMLILSLGLAGNIFAMGSVTAVAPGLFSFAIEQVISMFATDDSCPLRICQNCRPNNEEADGDGDGDCRPREN